MSILGNAVRRVEDPRLVRGDHNYVDDLDLPGALHAVFVRSPLAHATFTSVDVDEARSMPGVVAVYTADDLGLKPWSASEFVPDTFSRPPLARGRVRFVGDQVAVVIAETRAQAVDAAETVFADYEPLDVVADMEAAKAPGAPLLFEEHGSNVAFMLPSSGEDVLEGADVVARVRTVNQRIAAAPLEVNAFAVRPEDGKLTAWASVQSPHGVRDELAEWFGIDKQDVRVIAPDVGGGFGAKGFAYAEFIVVTAAALELGRPVKWVETRSENLVAMTHGRGQVQDVELGAKRDGTIVGLRVHITQETGAYPAVGTVLPFLTRLMASGVYRIPRIDVSVESVATNTTPTAAYRGAGRPEAAAMIERAVDVLAAELGMDPVEVRRKNFVDAFPYATPTGASYDSGDYDRALSEALRVAGYDDLREEQRRRRESGDRVQVGIGISVYVEITGQGAPAEGEYAAVEVEPDGTVTVRSGSSAHGQGHHTTFGQLAAELFGLPLDKVRVVQSDTAEVVRGSGTAGSRSLQLGGSALWKAGEAVVEKARTLAAHLLEAAPEDIALHEGGLGVAGAPDTAIDWAELAKAAADPARLPDGMEPGLRVELDFAQENSTYPFGAHVAVVDVDTETGLVHLRRHVAVDDCGRIVNPMIVRGQQHGGIAQGIGQAMYEQFVYDDGGNPLTGNFAMYGFPSAAEFPSFEALNTETPSPLNPLGAKGIGESGTIGSTPAVQNAVVDALAHLGVRHVDMPVTPERVWRAIQDASA